MLIPRTTRQLALAFLLAVDLVGCSATRKTDVLEARLRSQEDMLAVYESEVTRVKTELSITRRETEDLRVQLADAGQPVVPAEESGAIFRADGIQFSALMTGGQDADGEAGHEKLSVVLVPHDHDGELVKLPGNIEIEAFDLSQPGGAQRIGHWKFDQRDSPDYWHKGVIQSGYQFELPWQTPPTGESVLLHGRLTTANGRQFDTTLTIKVDPPTGDAGVPLVEGIQQASAESSSPDPLASEGIIWADDKATSQDHTNQRPPSPRSTARSMSGSEFSRHLDRPAPLTVTDAAPLPQRRRPRHLDSRLDDYLEGATREVPPAIEDWWTNDELSETVPTPPAESDRPTVQTSDSFSKESPRRNH